MRNDPRPPRIAQWLLALRRLGVHRSEVESDLLELFSARLVAHGRWTATWRYLADVVSLWKWRPRLEATGRRHPSGGTGMVQDIVFAVRLFRRHPGLYAITVAGLAVAIGVATGVLSVAKSCGLGGYGAAASQAVQRVALRTGPLTRVTAGDSPYYGEWTFSDYSQLRALSTTLTLVASARDRGEFRASPNDPTPVVLEYRAVSGNYFATLGMRAAVGRLLSPADDLPGSSNVVLSQGFWKNKLGADPSIVGRTIWIGHRSYGVVGVADRRHAGTPLWTSLAAYRDSWAGRTNAEAESLRRRLETLEHGSSNDPTARERYDAAREELKKPRQNWNPAVDVLGRLRANVTRGHAQAEMGSLASHLADAAGFKGRVSVHLEAIDQVTTSMKIVGAILLTVIGLVLLVACANVTNVLLASAASRRREISTRLAVGASRARVFRQLLTESLLLSSVSGVLGLGIAVAVLPTFAALVQVPAEFDVSPDRWIFASLVLITLVVGVVAGLAPARYGRRQDLATAFKLDQAAAPLPLPRARLRSLLIGFQAAVSAILLVLASLLARSLFEINRVAAAFDVGPVMTFAISAPDADWEDTQRQAYLAGMLEQVRHVPGVAFAAFATAPAFAGATIPEMVNGRLLERNEASPEYFQAVGIGLLRGRSFSPDDARTDAPVAIISESLARQVWGSSDPINASMDVVWGTAKAADPKDRTCFRKPKDTRVIGVVADLKGPIERQLPTVYLPLSQSAIPRLVVRATDEPQPLVRPIRDVLQSFDPRQQATVSFARKELSRQLQWPRTLALLSLTVSGVALGLAVIGLFGVTAFVVEQRTHELSVRRALGADHTQLMVMLLRESLRPVTIGLALGLVVSIAGSRGLQIVLYGVSPRDPLAFVGAVAVLVAAACAAVLAPARRVARVNPAHLLRLG